MSRAVSNFATAAAWSELPEAGYSGFVLLGLITTSEIMRVGAY